MTPKRLSAEQLKELKCYMSPVGIVADLTGHIEAIESELAAVTKERDESVKIRVHYDRRFSAGIFLTEKEYLILNRELSEARAEIQQLKEKLN